MDLVNLKHDADLIRKAYTVNPDNSVTANRDLELYIPKRFTENGMAVVGEKVQTVAVIGVVIPGVAYAPIVALADFTLLPLTIREVSIKGEQYILMEFMKGDTLIESLAVLQDPNKPNQYYLEFKHYARIPWYLKKEELSGMFDNAQYESGAPVGSTPQVTRVYDGFMFRDPDELTRPYRNSKAMLEGREPAIVGLNNSALLVDGTFSKLTGGWLQDNTLAAIVNPDQKVTDMEKVIKGVPE